jgi:toxin ParE1/3/4
VADYRLAGTAEAEIGEVLAWSEERFGEQGQVRYSALIVAAMADVADDPGQALVDWRRLSRVDVGIYRIVHSRDRVPDPPGRVREPRHALVFRVAEDGLVDILGIIHDRMLLSRALRQIVRSNRDEP